MVVGYVVVTTLVCMAVVGFQTVLVTVLSMVVGLLTVVGTMDSEGTTRVFVTTEDSVWVMVFHCVEVTVWHSGTLPYGETSPWRVQLT